MCLPGEVAFLIAVYDYNAVLWVGLGTFVMVSNIESPDFIILLREKQMNAIHL